MSALHEDNKLENPAHTEAEAQQRSKSSPPLIAILFAIGLVAVGLAYYFNVFTVPF